MLSFQMLNYFGILLIAQFPAVVDNSEKQSDGYGNNPSTVDYCFDDPLQLKLLRSRQCTTSGNKIDL